MGKRAECISAFAELFRVHMRNGTRPDGRPGEMGRMWNNKRLAGEIGASPRTIRNWLNGETLPAELEPIERVFFGDIRRYDSERRQLRELYVAAMSVRSVPRVRWIRIGDTDLMKWLKECGDLTKWNWTAGFPRVIKTPHHCGKTSSYDLDFVPTFTK